MARHPQQPTEKATVLIQPDIRLLYLEASVCVDVAFSVAAYKSLVSECGTDSREFFFACSSVGDPEVALIIRSISERPRLLHVTVTYRRDKDAPFPKLPKTKVRSIVKKLARGDQFTFCHAAQTLDGPPNSELSRFVTLESGRRLRLTGMQYELIDDQDMPTGHGTKIRIAKDGKLRWTQWTKERREVPSFEMALRLGETAAASTTKGD